MFNHIDRDEIHVARLHLTAEGTLRGREQNLLERGRGFLGKTSEKIHLKGVRVLPRANAIINNILLLKLLRSLLKDDSWSFSRYLFFFMSVAFLFNESFFFWEHHT